MSRRVHCLFRWLRKDGVDHPVTEQVAHIYMDEVFRNGSKDTDVLVLGCHALPAVASATSSRGSAARLDRGFGRVYGCGGRKKMGSAKPESRDPKLSFFAT